MKKIFYLALSLFLVALVGCNNNPTDPGGGGLGGIGGDGNNGGGTVNIQVQGQVDGQGLYIFSLKPSANISLTTVTASVPAVPYMENFDFTGQGEWQANTYEGFLQYNATDIQQGQAWTFKLVGKTTADNKEFTVTSNYTIP